MVAQTRTAGHSAPRKLKFHDKLTGKNLTTDALLKKLKALHTELAEMEQENIDTNSLGAVRKELISTSIFLHKDRGVKAYAACCLADLLRLYAPDAPYTERELGDIFAFFFRQLSQNLKGPDSPYYNEYFHLLESLSTVKSVVLVCDLPNAEELMVDVFKSFFSMVRLDLAKKIELFMTDILVAIIDECQSLPTEVLEILMAQFLDTNARIEQPAYRLAVQVCSQTADKLQRQVCQYFTDVIVSHSRDEEFDEVQKAHTLIKRLHHACPALLHNVVPQLEEELRVQETQIRVMATQTLGEMFAEEKHGADLARKYTATWTMWLSRKNDQAIAVRLAFVEAAKGLLVTTTPVDVGEKIEDALYSKLLDPDEKVRAAVCKVYGQIDYETALHHVSERQLRAVAGRGIDKKPSVQVEAMKAIARLFSLAFPEIDHADPAAAKHFAWIPQEILHMGQMAPEVKTLAEQVFTDYILPLPSNNGKNSEVDELAWTDRLLCVMKFLDITATNILLGFSNIKLSRPTLYEKYLESCVDNNGGVIDDDEEKVIATLNTNIKKVATQFSDPQKFTEDLNAFARLNEGRLYKLLKTCLDPQTDLKGLVKASHEFLRRLEQSSASIVPTMSAFLRRATLHIVNQSSVAILIKRVQKGAEGAAQHAKTWLTYISKHLPALYKLHIGELSKAIADEKNGLLVEVCLQAYSAAARWDPKLVPNDKRTVERLQRYALGENYRHAKFAARLVSATSDAEEICVDIVETISESLPDAEPIMLVAHIAALAQFAKFACVAFEQKSDVIMAFLLKHVLMNPTPPDDNAMDTDEEWVEDDQMSPPLRAKILALKTCRQRCLTHAQSETALDIARPVLRMFTTLLEYSGSFTQDANDDLKTKARMRLQAAISLLHLATEPKFADEVAVNFVLLAITMQDPCFQVRMAFLTKLIILLTPRRLGPTYNVIPFLAVHDPEADIVNRARAYVVMGRQLMVKQQRLESFEMNFVRFLHLLAHHPDFQLTEEAIPDIARYIEFFLDLVCNQENIGLLYHLAMKLKTVRDTHSHSHSENLYALGELAQHLLKARAKQHAWSIESYPGKARLPPDILKPLPSAEAANQILKTVYLPEGVVRWLDERGVRARKTGTGEKKPATRAGEKKAGAKRKAREVGAGRVNGHAKRARTKGRKRKQASDDESSESSSEDEEQEDEEQEEEREDHRSDDGGEDDEKENEGRIGASDTSDREEQKEERLGRGARTRAKARIKQQVKTKKAGKGKAKEG